MSDNFVENSYSQLVVLTLQLCREGAVKGITFYPDGRIKDVYFGRHTLSAADVPPSEDDTGKN